LAPRPGRARTLSLGWCGPRRRHCQPPGAALQACAKRVLESPRPNARSAPRTLAGPRPSPAGHPPGNPGGPPPVARGPRRRISVLPVPLTCVAVSHGSGSRCSVPG
jgi:hypothetical protein